MRHTLVCTVILIVSIVIGYQIDSLQYFLRNYASQTFDYVPVFWVSGAIPIVIASLEISFAWFVLVRHRMPWVVSAVYTVVGLVAGILSVVVLRLAYSVLAIQRDAFSPIIDFAHGAGWGVFSHNGLGWRNSEHQ